MAVSKAAPLVPVVVSPNVVEPPPPPAVTFVNSILAIVQHLCIRCRCKITVFCAYQSRCYLCGMKSANMKNKTNDLGKLLPEGQKEPKAEKADTRAVKALERLIEGLERARWSWMMYK